MKDEEKICEIVTQLEKLQIIKKYYDIEIRLSSIKKRVMDKVFRMAVVGEYSSGKSTFINALIGNDLLSHARSETTATITYIHNVGKDDPKNGTCIINYQSGEKEQLDDMDKLSEYTTAQSGLEVAKDIRSVEIYVNFMQSNYPIIIIDTPGLNGNAEYHRDITIKETCSAHACIYLFSLHGITKFDEQFIGELSEYQRKFIIVQNFIDELKASEGESMETKVAQMNEIMREQIVAGGIKIDYSICGISALKALVGKDNSINRLYNSDTEDITEEDRLRYYKESNFDEFLSILMNLIVSGEYQQIIIASALQALESIVSKLYKLLDTQSKENAKLMNKDERNLVIQKANERLKYIENNRKKQEDKIKNFIISKDKGNRTILKNKVKVMLEDAAKYINDVLDEELSDYNSYKALQERTNNKTGKYFSDKIATIVNVNIASELKNDIEVCLQVLYEDALQRSVQYSGTMLDGASGIFDVTIAELDENFKAGTQDLLEDIEEQKQRLYDERKSIYDIEKFIDKNEEEILKVKEDIKKVDDSYCYKINRKNIEKQKLGTRPEYRTWQVKKQCQQARGGLFGGIGDFLFGKKIKTVSVTMSNADELAAWDKKYREKIEEEERIRQKRENEINRLKDKIIDLENQVDEKLLNKEIIYKKIERYEYEITNKEEEYEMVLSNARKEFCNTQKNYMKNEFSRKLFEAENNMQDRFIEYINKYSEANIKNMIEKVLKVYNEQTEYNIGRLKAVLSDNVEQLEQEYNIQKYELEIIEKAKEYINDIKNRGNYTYEPV